MIEKETCVIAAEYLPAGIISMPVGAEVPLEKLLDRRLPELEYKVEVDHGFLKLCNSQYVDGELSMLMRLAPDIHEQNVALVKTANFYVLQTTRAIQAGEELRFWFNLEVSCELQIPVLTPRHILGNQRYVCDSCDATFPQPNILKAHLCLNRCANEHLRDTRIEHDVGLAMTPETNTSNTSNDEEDEDDMSLTGDSRKKGHMCMFCGKVYSRRYGLKIHVRTHTGYKPLQCRFCQRPFSDPSNLNKHVRLHAELDSPYRCSLCDKALVRKRDLERHLKTKHCVP